MDLNKKHLLYLIVFFLFLSLNAFGQSNNITGRILDQSTKEPVEYANVTLFRQDSVFIEGTVSDTIGRFGFTNLISDDYVLLISYMGFETKKILLQNFLESVEIDVFSVPYIHIAHALEQAFNFTFGNVHKEISNDKK